MTAYHYKAFDDQGGVQKGLLEGDSARQIRQQLRDKQWTPVEVSAVNDRQSKNKSRYKKPSAYELALRKGFVGTEDEWLQLLYFNRDVFLSESEYALLVQNDAVDLTKKYLIYEDDN